MSNSALNIESPSTFEHECVGFYPAGLRPFRKLIPEPERLIDWQKDTEVDYSAVSLHRLRNVRVWTDYQVICIYTEDNQIIESLSLYDDNFDFNEVNKIPIRPLSGTTVLVPHLDPYNYYHWVVDTLAFPGVLEMGGVSLDSIDNLYIHRMENNFQRKHLEALGIDESKLHFLDNGRKQHFVIEELLVPRFRMDGGYWPAPWSMGYLQKTYLDEHIAENLLEREPTGNRIYVVRGEARRKIENESELIQRLQAEGYEIVEPHAMSLEEQAAVFSQADYVLGSHGAGLANIVFCKPDTKLLEFGGHYLTAHFRILATINELDYEAIAAGVDENGTLLSTDYAGESRDLGFTVDIERVISEANGYFNYND